MHIADITMFWAASSGGVRTYLEAKGRWLASQTAIGHSLLVPGRSSSYDGEKVTLPSPSIPFGHGYRFPVRKSPWVDTLVSLKPDIIEAGDPYVLPWAALEAGRQLKVPVIGFYHSDLPRLVANRMGDSLGLRLQYYVKKLYGQFDRVLAPSDATTRTLKKLGLREVYTQPLGVDTSSFHPNRRDKCFRSELGISETTHLLIFAGRGSKEKNIPVLLQVMDLLGEKYHLHLAGANMPSRLPSNVSRSEKFLDQVELARRMASCDALVHAGDRETFGLVVLEAMASGLPVVGVRAGSVSELVVPGCGLLAQPNSASSIAESVQQLCLFGSGEMGRSARRHVEKNYTWDKVLNGILQHYQELSGVTCELPQSAHG